MAEVAEASGEDHVNTIQDGQVQDLESLDEVNLRLHQIQGGRRRWLVKLLGSRC